MEAEAAALAAQAIKQQRQRLQKHRAHQLGGATEKTFNHASGSSSSSAAAAAATTAALGPAPHTIVGPDGRLPDGRYPDRLPPRKTQQQLLRQQQRKRRLNGQSSSSSAQVAKPRGSAFYDRFLHGYQREGMAEMRTRAAIEKQAKDMNLGLSADQIDALLAATLQGGGGGGVSNSGDDDDGKTRAKSKPKKSSGGTTGGGKISPRSSPSKNKKKVSGYQQPVGQATNPHPGGGSSGGTEVVVDGQSGLGEDAPPSRLAGSPGDFTIGYGDGGAASTSLSRRSVGGFGGGGSLAEAIGNLNANSASRVRDGHAGDHRRGHQGEYEEEEDEENDGEFDAVGEENDQGDSGGGADGSLEVDSQEEWRQKWAAGSADSNSDDNEASSDDDAEEEKSLAEYQDTRRRLAKQQGQEQQAKPQEEKQVKQQSKRLSPPRSPEAAVALQDLLAQAAAAAAGGGAAALGDSGSVAELLEQLAAKARQLDSHSTVASDAAASRQAQPKKKAPAPALRAPSSTKVSAPKAVAAAQAALPPGVPVVRCSFCNLLPAARQCMDCPTSGCAACWARAHKAPELRNHRFELMGLAKAQVRYQHTYCCCLLVLL
jgi:hypothetical protein